MILVNARSFKALQRQHWSFPGLTGTDSLGVLRTERIKCFDFVACLSMHGIMEYKIYELECCQRIIIRLFPFFLLVMKTQYFYMSLKLLPVSNLVLFNVSIPVAGGRGGGGFEWLCFSHVLTSCSFLNFYSEFVSPNSAHVSKKYRFVP